MLSDQAGWQNQAQEGAEPQLPVVFDVFERRGEGLAWRIGAAFVDSLIVMAAAGLAAIVTGLLAAGEPDAIAYALGAYVAVGAFAQVAYMTAAEGLWGTTLGKRLGAFPSALVVRRLDGSPAGFREAALRAALGLIEANLVFGPFGGLLATLVVAVRKDNRRLGDLVAGTWVLDATKPMRATVHEAGVTLDMVDGRTLDLVRLDDAYVSTWLGKPQTLHVRGADATGTHVKQRMRYLSGATVFSVEPGMQGLRAWLEWRFGKPVGERLQWWRLALVAGTFGIAAFSFVLSATISSLD